MKYNPGQKVRIKDTNWYFDNIDESGCIDCGAYIFSPEMIGFLDKIVTISYIEHENFGDGYVMEKNDCENFMYRFTDDMIAYPVAEAGKEIEMIELYKAAEWVKNAFIGTFGEGLANGIKEEFIKAMRK